MRRKALLVGSQTYGLTGVEHDVDTMADLLESRGFQVVRGVGAQATRDAILDAIERLIRDAGHDDAVVFYYSGHGGIAVSTARSEARVPAPRLQFLVPTDFEDSTPSEFRGITDPELSVLLARLTWATPNATVIIDACHAAHAMRGEIRTKALDQHAYLDVSAHLDRLYRKGLDPSIRHVLGNPDAVRVVACRRDQSAYEYTNAEGRRIGLFTESLAVELGRAAAQPVTWASLIERVRDRVCSLIPSQRPEAEGPSHRLPFQTSVAYPSDRPASPGPHPLGADVGIEWGRVVDGRPYPLSPEGATVQSGEPVYVRVHNRSAFTVYLSLLLVEDYARVSLITSLDPSGMEIRSDEERTVGSDELDGRLVGIELAWPDDIGHRDALTRTITVLICSRPLDMAGERLAGTPPHLRSTVSRELRPAEEDDLLRRDVHPITFRLLPHPGLRPG